LLTRSVANIETGQAFDPQYVALLRLRPRLVGNDPERAQAFHREAKRQLESLSGIVSVSLTAAAGFVWTEGFPAAISLPGEQRALPGHERSAGRQQIAPRFSATLGIPFVAGRDFDDHDMADSPRLAIVSETLAREFWPASSALEKTIVIEGQPHRVMGVAKDSQLRSNTQGQVFCSWPRWRLRICRHNERRG
jgi:hypothetical protein